MDKDWTHDLVSSQTGDSSKISRIDAKGHSLEPQGVQKDTEKAQEGEPSQAAPSTAVEDASQYEETHVHAVYEAIADHFSATRYAPWPLVAQFLAAQPAGSIGLDVGCGNGKYLSGASGAPPPRSGANETDSTDQQLFILGSDRSEALVRLARAKHARRQRGADVLLADSLALPFRDQCADFIICIAVVHHLSTRERRQAAVQELLRCVRRSQSPEKVCQNKPAHVIQSQSTTAATSDPKVSASSSSPTFLSGRVLLYVWALEQASSRRGWEAGGDQDLLVPWVKTMKDRSKTGASQAKGQGKQNDPKKRRTGIEETPKEEQTQKPHVPPTFHRYYHLYKQGELEDDVAAVGGRVVASGYEKDNWWVVADVL
ncbi:tRNA methyltransferase, has a role in tRNA modification [Sporothrix epigloea]|uniref:tRNA methyltransferase, has a role in tRNA modification n=1 Tax=Sporothrix epigloea TaxID=1892477 RepID=A0ABP0E6L8_9PEZI